MSQRAQKFLKLSVENPLEHTIKKDPIITSEPIVQLTGLNYDHFNFLEARKFCKGYDNQEYVINHVQHSILPDLENYPYDDEIKNKADTIFSSMKYQVRRGKIRNQLLFYCVYCAHLELDRHVNPIILGTQFNLNQGSIQKCESLFSPLQTGYRPPNKNVSPLGYLPDYCKAMDNLSESTVNSIMKMAENIQ